MRTLIICAAPEENLGYVKQLAEKADKILCADGGTQYAIALGLAPDMIIGDFDSFDGEINGINTLRLNPRKDDTDTICCIKKAIELGSNEIVLVCAVGGRVDHTIANISTLIYMNERGVKGEIVSSAERISLLTEGEYSFENRCGKTFSLFAVSQEGCVVSYQNAEYPLSRHRLIVSRPLGISNKFSQDLARIKVHSGKAVLVINEVL